MIYTQPLKGKDWEDLDGMAWVMDGDSWQGLLRVGKGDVVNINDKLRLVHGIEVCMDSVTHGIAKMIVYASNYEE